MVSGTSISKEEFALFQAYIASESGITLDEGKTYLVESRLKGLLDVYDCANYGDLYQKAKTSSAPLIRSKIIEAMTTNETLWFRDQSPYMIFDEVFLPEMARQLRAGKPKVRVWSAACSTGQEPYSMAMVISEFCRRHGNLSLDQFEIVATDISAEALSVGKLGAYDSIAMGRGMADTFREKYFKQSGKFWIIDAALKKIIDFKVFNLMDSFSPLGTFDAIFCRNVAIYFSQDFKIELFRKMKRALHPGGMFMLGSSETLAYYSKEFEARSHKNHTYYTG